MRRRRWSTRLGSALFAAILLFQGLPCAAAAEQDTVWLTGKFNSSAYPDRELSYSFPYRDDYFTVSASEYQHPLAQCSLGLAVSAFRAADLDLDRKDEYARSYLSQAGFGDMVSQQFDEKPRADTIATLIASKKLFDAEGEFLLVAVAVSGGGYEDEWLSNFSFGDSSVHDGFFSAAFTVFQRIFDYVDTCAGDKRFKLWISGYSRAAAVSNMTAALTLAAEQVDKTDLYTYTFATPNSIRAESGDFELDGTYDYSGIFNIIGMFDPVPSIPFQEWGYGKLGTTFHLPAQETTSDYGVRREPVAAIYRDITGAEYSNNPEANWFVQKLYQLIYDMIRTAGSYQSDLENMIHEAWVNNSSVMQLLRSLCGVLSQGGEINGKLIGEAPSADTLLSVFLYDLAMEKLGLRPSSWNDLNLMMQLFYEHCPEVYVAWMMSQDDPGDLFVVETDYRRIFFDSHVKYEVQDEDGQPLKTVCAVELGKTVMITVPASRTHTVTLSGGKAGERIKVVEYSANSLHYAYQLYTMENAGDTYELTLPMEFWHTWDDGGLVRASDSNPVAPTMQALERSQVHPSAVFELEDSGFAASNALNILLGIAIFLLILVIALPVILILILRKRQKKKTLTATMPGRQ